MVATKHSFANGQAGSGLQPGAKTSRHLTPRSDSVGKGGRGGLEVWGKCRRLLKSCGLPKSCGGWDQGASQCCSARRRSLGARGDAKKTDPGAPSPASLGGHADVSSPQWLRANVPVAVRPVAIRLVIIALLMAVTAANGVAQDGIDAAAVSRSIDRGVAYLRKSQTERGGWTEYGGHSCGLSALCTLSLLNAGVSRDDPDMIRALRYLRTFEPRDTYSVALQTLVFCDVGAAGDLPRIRRNVQWLIDEQKTGVGDARRVGAWAYGRDRGSGDPSNSQFALLALGAAVDRGIEVDPETFQRALEYWKGRQLPGGGWSYGGARATGSMTCAGIASIIIAEGRLPAGSSQIDGKSIKCCGGSDSATNPVDDALEYLGNVFSVTVNPGGQSLAYYYYMYALERVGRLSGRRFIGGHDWYREGAERLVNQQDDFQGFWSGTGPIESNEDIATAFALLFLGKGKRQVVVGQLRYDAPQHGAGNPQWQEHPDALRQLVRHVERDWRRDLTWQTVQGSRATVADLLQTPVLVIRGRDALNLSDQLTQRLKQYVDQGGCLLFEASGGDGCGDASAFEASVRELTGRWFPGAPLERLPPDHPVWYAERKVDPVALGDDFWVHGVQACCRTAVFFVPKSLSCRWELSGELFYRTETESQARKQIAAAVGLGENVIAYATGRELKDKLQQRTVLEGSELAETRRGTIQIARLSLDAGGDDAQRALPNAAALIRRRIPLEIAAAADPVGFDPETLRQVPMLWIHGRTEFTLSQSQRTALRQYIESGGFIFGSAICGNEAFAEAFRREISEILPETALRRMGADHPALSSKYGGYDLSNVTIRRPADSGQSLEVVRRQASPALEVATVDSIESVFFSPLDLSCALESQNSIQCPGYPTEDAAKIVANLILFALQQ